MENFSALAKINISVIKKYQQKNDDKKLKAALKRVDIFYAAEKLTDDEYTYIQELINGRQGA